MATEISHLYARISADTADFERGMKASGSAVTSLAGMLSGGLVVAAAAGVAALAGVGAVISSGISKSAAFEQSFADLAAAMGTTRDKIEPLGKLISNLALDPTLKVNANEATLAVKNLALAGISMDEILGGAARSAVLLANATGTDLGTSAELASQIMSQFNIKAADMGHVVDGILGVTQATTFNVQDMAGAIAMAGGMAASVGVTYDDFNAVIAATATRFSGGSDAGTSFKTFLTRLVPQSKEAAEEMKALGLITADGTNRFFDANEAMKSSEEIAALLSEAFSGLTDVQRLNAATTIFSTDAMRIAFGLADTGREGILKLKETIGNTDAEAAAVERTNTLAAKWENLRGIWDETSKLIGDKFKPALITIVDWATAASNKYLPSVVEWFGKLGAWVVELLPKIEAWVGKLRTWGATISEWAQNGELGMNLFAIAAEKMRSTATWAFTTLVEWVRTNLPIWKQNLYDWAAAAGDWIIDVGWPRLRTNIATWFGNLRDWMREKWPEWVAALREWGIATGDWIVDVAWPATRTRIGEWWTRFSAWFRDNLPNFVRVLADWGVQLVAWVIDGLALILTTLADGMHAVKEWLRGTGQSEVQSGTGDWAKAFVKWLKDDAWPILKPALLDLLDSLIDLAGQSVGLIFDAAMAVGRAIVNGMIAGAKEIWDDATWLWRRLPENLIDNFNYLLGIHSPSTVFAEIGANLMLGFAQGIDNNRQLAIDAVNGVYRAITQTELAAQGEIALRGGYSALFAAQSANNQAAAAAQAQQSWASMTAPSAPTGRQSGYDYWLDLAHRAQLAPAGTTVTIENMYLGGGTGSSTMDLQAAVALMNAMYGYGY